MESAVKSVLEEGLTVYAAAKRAGVPQQTLRDRINGRVDWTQLTKNTTFSREEEQQLVDHIKTVAAVGYGYTRTEVLTLATDFAVLTNKRTYDEPLTTK